jgi:4-carboxymuconolactone decarboxylase
LRFHLPNAVKNGVKEEELIEAITHLAFYSGWPNAMSPMAVAKELLRNPQQVRIVPNRVAANCVGA